MNYQKDVSDFMILGEQKISSDLNLKNEQALLYMNLIKEEFEETTKAFYDEDLVEVADGLADMVWVIMGMCNSVGIDFDKVWKDGDRDYWMTAEEAKAYGMIDEVLVRNK